MQNKCIRILTFAPFNSHIPNQIFINLKLLKVRDVIKLSQLKLVYDFQCSILPDDLMSLFHLSGDVRSYTFLNSVVNKLLFIPQFQTISYGSHSLRYQGPKL